MARISIAMATYNGAEYLEQQLESLRTQTIPPAELHIGDDGSTDSTEEIVRRFVRDAPFPVHFRKNPARLGFGENFIQTALRCSGEWIAFCDQDDVWLPTKLERCVEEIARGPADLALIAHNATITDAHLRPAGTLYKYPMRKLTPVLGLSPEWYCIGATQVFRADLLSAIPCDRRASFPWHSHREAHDVWVALIANATGSILRLNDQLIRYRRHQSTVTQDSEAQARWLSFLADKSSDYASRASYLREVASILTECAASSSNFATELDQASEQIRIQADFLESRGAAYHGSAGKRIAEITRLFRRGGYVGTRGWPFGWKRLVADILAASMPVRTFTKSEGS
jgi:glycosyltransferase involved in cell wall biosynthesis